MYGLISRRSRISQAIIMLSNSLFGRALSPLKENRQKLHYIALMQILITNVKQNCMICHQKRLAKSGSHIEK